MRRFFISLTRNPVSLIGAAITTASAMLMVSLFSIELFGFLGNPYIGILAYLVLPAILVFGLALIPLGVFIDRRKRRHARARGEASRGFPVIDLNLANVRTWVLFFILLSAVNVVILATATFKGVEVMESTEFCGTTCHSVMAPEYTAFQNSPHARVRCVECHIGPGADWFVKSKLSGAWQVISTTFELYPRPIPTPVHDLRPARETCEQCHWPTKFVGDRLKVITRFEEDEENTELKTVLLMRVGGMRGGHSRGIHWHVDPNIQVRYRADPTRETIYDVELNAADGTVKTFHRGGDANGNPAEAAEWRVMDCVDCHNRPSHAYQLPEVEIDRALETGRLPRSLPHLRREGLIALKAEYASHEQARSGIRAALQAHYAPAHPAAEIEQAASVLGEIYARNVFPGMRVTWGTYPQHIGHEASDGCFRCHNDEHATADGEVISQDCDTCHALLALEEEDPDVLRTLDF